MPQVLEDSIKQVYSHVQEESALELVNKINNMRKTLSSIQGWLESRRKTLETFNEAEPKSMTVQNRCTLKLTKSKIWHQSSTNNLAKPLLLYKGAVQKEEGMSL